MLGVIVTRWQLQEAKNRLSEVVRKASDEGPQVITLRGDDAVVVVAAGEYARLTRKSKGALVDFLRKSPLGTVALDLTRSRDTGRRVKL
jgi:prevent-host-death family protein